ncbi:hypothetical protein ACIQ2D_15115 [Lysinibacillus sp. NPDC097287]|uniref:hypothetical protein n=1 Tax=Lysinibacillus sp. NPDC097287 TaxID=3364144 RepID=UPI003819B3F2
MKKLVIETILIVIVLALFITYNHLQQPTENDVLHLTEKWSESAEEVFWVRKIDDKWLAIFRNSQSVTIAELQQNWLGTWKFKNNETLSSISYPPRLEDQMDWSASGKSEENVAYYFGMVTDPEITIITVETQDDVFENASFIKYEGMRFFIKRGEGPLVLPVNISGFSKSGELIYSTLGKISPNKD